MKTKLFTQNSFLVMIMTFVLVLGLQDTADAITRLTRGSGDLQTVTAGRDYQIRFSVTLQSPMRLPNHKPVPATDINGASVPAAERTNMFYDDTAGNGYTQGGATLTYAAAHNYDQESIAIAASGGEIKKVGSYDAPSGSGTTATPLNMYERTHAMYSTTENAHQRLSGSVALTLTAPATAAIVTITITPTTDPTTGDPDPLAFTIYVVGALNPDGATAVLAATEGVQRVSDQADTRIDGHFDFEDPVGTAAPNEPVYYTVEGSGRLYVSPAADGAVSPVSDRKTSPTKNLYTSSSAPVFLDTTGGSSKVTAYISGSGDTATVLYVFSGGRLTELPQITIQSGDSQTGAPSGRLEDYFEVRVTDGRRRPISGVPVTFTKADPSTPTTGSMFIPVSGTRVYATAPDEEAIDAGRPTTVEATATAPAAADTHSVQTDRNGVAQIYYQLSSNSGAHTVSAAVTAIDISKTLTATASSSARARTANIEILSGDNQRADKGKDLTDPLVVIVRSLAGHRVQNVIVQFRTTTGTLVPDATTEQPDSVTDLGLDANSPFNPTSGQQIYVKTGPNGEAGVTYNIGQLVEARTVTAEVRREVQAGIQYDFAIREVAFDVNGTGSSQQNQQNQQNQQQVTTPTAPPTLSVSPTNISGAPSSSRTLTITTTVPLAQISVNLSAAFRTAGGFASPATATATPNTYTSTLTLPTTANTYTATVNAGTTARQITITVGAGTGSAPTDGTVTVGIQPGSGDPGTPATVTVRATDSNNQPANVSVALSITAGGGTFANGATSTTVSTGTTGTATTTLTRGSTAGSNYFITASVPTGYTFSGPSSGERVIITGTQSSTGDPSVPRAAGEAAAIDVYDGDGQRGTPNVRLAEMLVVEVTDANGNPVSGERVTFRTTIGSGQFSPTRPRTNGNGRAQTWFTPTSSGTIRISASVAGVSARAVFRVTTGAPPASLTKVSGDNQSGTVGDALGNPFVVEVKNADGDTIEGLPVAFSVTAGGGRLSETSATTDANGRAETTLTLGRQRGVNSVEASVSGVDPVTFSTSIDATILVSAANRPVMYWIAGGALYRLAGAKEAKIAENVNGAAIGGGKLYWTSTTGASAGTISSANLDGSGAKTLATIMAVPMGIAVDTAGSQLYWTNSRGRIQSANLNGKSIQNVVQNRSNPMDIVLHGGFIYWTEDGSSIHRVSRTGQKTVRDVAVSLSSVGGLAIGAGKVYWTEATGASAGTINGADLDGTQFETLATLKAAPMGIAVDTVGSKLYWTNSRGRVQSGTLTAGKIRNVVEGIISPSALVIGGANTAETVATQPAQPAKKDNAAYDVNGDGVVDNTDASLVSTAMNTTNAKYDVNGDGVVNFLDLLLVFDNRDDAATAPTIVGMKLSAVQIDVLQEQIDLLIATGDRSPAAMRTLVYLQQLIATARPEKTQLLANYPNPFNPETWIPYELATDTNVRITIYNTQGVVIRTLVLGHQSAGYYTGRDRAAYWDGRNAFGEHVASGIYFYQFETDTLSSMRKMVILK